MQILVLGMHRSGTSLTTGLIRLMGAYVGPDELLLPANKANEKGFWERRDVMNINESLLRLQGGSWLEVAGWQPPADIPYSIRAAMQAVLADLNENSPWVMKDPRLCLTLPCWLPDLTSPVAVIVSRHPHEVAQSLHMRNGIALEHGLALWEQHVQALLHNTQHLHRIFCRYDDLLADPIGESGRLCAALGLTLPDEAILTDFISPAMKRAQVNEKAALTKNQQRLYAMLRGEEEWSRLHINF